MQGVTDDEKGSNRDSDHNYPGGRACADDLEFGHRH